MSNANIHLQACKGYKYTGTTVALDWSEDSLIEARVFWDELGMRQKINSAVAEVEAKYEVGELRWNWRGVRSLIGDYPKRGQLDVLLPWQEDEATPDPEGVPWEIEDHLSDSDEDEVAACSEEDEVAACIGEAAGCELAPAEVPSDDEQSMLDHRGNGGASATSEIAREALSVEQADSLLGHCSMIEALQQAKDLVGGAVGGPVGASLQNTLGKVMHDARKKFDQRMRGDAAVAAELRAVVEEDEAVCKRERVEFQNTMKRKREFA